ncbi:hypothetical protein MLD38_020459 [Melastoma candidum]|uniref:Uncharacterized protein n=1 Tax=Melastoma candidum TaxID=119954 RepID=A0ACB9QG08_9MYRT|nr:hypothetical protein MLD38_020459 [Melastoma candidum]
MLAPGFHSLGMLSIAFLGSNVSSFWPSMYCLLILGAYYFLGRPLISTFGNPCFGKKLLTFAGHLSINDPRLRLNHETREAVATSHCSQPNTLEYDLAMEWCLLQQRSKLAWKMLVKRQERELRQLSATLNPKFPIFFLLRTPVCIQSGGSLEAMFWRRASSSKVWYKWCVSSPSPSAIHNINGRSYWVGL